MTIGPALAYELLDTTAITDLVGQRVYPNYARIADKLYPMIVWKTENTTTITSYSAGTNPLQSCNVVLACIGETYASADAIATVLITAMDGFKGTWNGTVIQGVFLNEDGIQDDVVTQPETEEILYHVKELTFLTWYVNQ